MVSLAIPVGPKPGWELEVEDLDGIKNVEDRQVLSVWRCLEFFQQIQSDFPLLARAMYVFMFVTSE
jgi:hypothetical protein